MKFSYHLYITLLLCTGAAIPGALAQKENPDSSEAAKIVRSDELYFDALKAKIKDDSKHAKELLEQYVAQRPNVAVAWYELAKIYYNEKKLELAATDIKKAIALNGTNKWYKEEYASILAEEGNYTEAAKLSAELAKAEPNDPGYLLMAAEYYDRAKMYDEAITYIDKALARNTGDEELLMHKVQLYLNLDQLDKAVAIVQQMISSEPKTGKYYKLLGEMYDNNKFPEKATEVYNKAQKIIPEDPSIQLGMAEHYLKLGDTLSYKTNLKKAIVNKDIDADTQLEFLKSFMQGLPDEATSVTEGLPVVKQLVEQHPNDAMVLAYYGDFLEAGGQHDSAIAVYKRSLLIKPSSFNVWRNLLGNYTEKQDADSLIRYSEKFMRLFPNQPLAHYYNGIGHLNKKDYQGAIKAINRAIDMQGENDKALLSSMYNTLADIYHASKQDDLSDAAFDKALQLDPNDPSILNNYSYYLSLRGVKLDAAEKMSKKSLELRPREATFLDTYGWILYKRGEYDKAREYVQKAIDLYGTKADATLYDHLGNIYYKLKNKEKAVENWKISKEKGNDDPLINKKITEEKLYE